MVSVVVVVVVGETDVVMLGAKWMKVWRLRGRARGSVGCCRCRGARKDSGMSSVG